MFFNICTMFCENFRVSFGVRVCSMYVCSTARVRVMVMVRVRVIVKVC